MFGIVASVLLLFSESVQWMRVGVLSALWAAVIGAFAMTKYRREAAADQTKAKDLQTVYELQLAREISARREYEMNVEARVRGESRMEIDEVAALRNELAALRQNLQVLFDGNLPTERVALRAEAMRMQELGGRRYDSYQPAPSGLYVPGGGNGNGPMGPDSGLNGVGTPYDEPVTAETSVVYPEDPDQMPQATAASTVPESQDRYAENSSESEEPSYNSVAPEAGAADPYERPAAQARPYSAPRQAARVTPPSSPFTAYNFEETRPPVAQPEPTTDDEPQTAAEPEPAEPQPTDTYAAEPYPAEPATDYASEPAYGSGSAQDGDAYPTTSSSLRDSADAFFSADRDDEPAAEDTSSAPRRGRRRTGSTDDDATGAHSNGRSVAEIMAGLQGGDGSDVATTDPGTRRRRRRSD
ncbi:putative integral membrane protein [Rhodococcus sp. AW25M09]|nr:putative integral membrane protein [Rhodococcus sp. AW25M09]